MRRSWSRSRIRRRAKRSEERGAPVGVLELGPVVGVGEGGEGRVGGRRAGVGGAVIVRVGRVRPLGAYHHVY